MLRCPRCDGPIPVSTKSVRKGNRCAQCGSELRVSEIYSRVLSVASMLLGAIVLWVIHVRNVSFFFWVFPAWLAVLSVLVRIVPHVLPPRLELHDSGPFISLGLGNEGEKDVASRS